ncbi:PLPL1 protein, partial [Baryphthengus martii]|nr:PLPL1 protein [Baryphthengus martii]
SLLLRGCSFFIFYQAGVCTALRDLSPGMLKAASKVYGASSGSIIATFALCECDMGKGCALPPRRCLEGSDAWKYWRNAVNLLKRTLNKHLPANVHQLVSGKLHVIITRVRDCRSVAVSQFSCKEDLIQALLCSCFVPIWFGMLPPLYHGVRYIDGEIGMWRANFVSRSTITISGIAGEYDICPREGPAAFLTFQISDCILQLSKRNIWRLMHVI